MSEYADAFKHGRESMEPRIAELEVALAESRTELADANSQIEGLDAKLKALGYRGKDICACSYDRHDAVCIVHSPQLLAATLKIAELEKRIVSQGALIQKLVHEACACDHDGNTVTDACAMHEDWLKEKLAEKEKELASWINGSNAKAFDSAHPQKPE